MFLKIYLFRIFSYFMDCFWTWNPNGNVLLVSFTSKLTTPSFHCKKTFASYKVKITLQENNASYSKLFQALKWFECIVSKNLNIQHSRGLYYQEYKLITNKPPVILSGISSWNYKNKMIILKSFQAYPMARESLMENEFNSHCQKN